MSAYRRLHDVDLRPLNTMGIAARAQTLIEVNDITALPELWPSFAQAPIVLGSGSNIVFADHPSVPVVRLRNDGIEQLSDDGDRVQWRVGAGKDWHELVMESVAQGLYGLENLAYIPGTVGACPIQNIGAYGVEVNSAVESVHAFEPATGEWHHLGNVDCEFAYRDSLFKRDLARFVITDVTFNLYRRGEPKLDYTGLRDALNLQDDEIPTPQRIAEAVVAVRKSKLPDPGVLGNSGSFFKNPIVPLPVASALSERYPDLPMFRGSCDATRKLSAAWLIDQAGWKGHREGDAGVAPGHALVLVNHGNAGGADIMQLAERIMHSVRERFGIAIEPEPRVIR